MVSSLRSVTPWVRVSFCFLHLSSIMLPLVRFSLSCCCYLLLGEDEQLSLKLINRPMLILRGENGFICHHKNSNTLDASRSVYDIFTLQHSNGAYQIKGQEETLKHMERLKLMTENQYFYELTLKDLHHLLQPTVVPLV